MIDEWCERQIDRLCAFVPAYFGPRMTRFCATRLGWRLSLYAVGFKRRVIDTVAKIPWIEKETPGAVTTAAEEKPVDPSLEGLDPALRQEIEAWNEEQKAWAEQAEKNRIKNRTLAQRAKLWWAGRHERGAARDERWAAREAEAEARAQERLSRALPALRAIEKSRFVFMLLMTALSVLGACAMGGGDMGCFAAACCAMWLACAFEIGYEPVCGGVRQRYLAAIFLRAGSFLSLLPMYFGAYVRQGVQSNVVLQSAMLILLFAHGVFFLALVAFHRKQPILLRALSGLLGTVPALTAAAGVALAAACMGRPLPLPVSGVASAAGALLAFCADRVLSITELGGIRLRYTPIWVSGFMEAGFLLMLIGAWTGTAGL